MSAAFPPGSYLYCLESLVKLHYNVVLRHIHIACHEQNTKTLELFVVTCGVFRGSYSCNVACYSHVAGFTCLENPQFMLF